MKNVVIESYEEYNPRRYGLPWVCVMTETGDHDFKTSVGTYTGDKRGDPGDLVIFSPIIGQVYGYGRKDYRGSNTQIKHAVWDGEKFVPCDKLGRVNGREVVPL